MPRLGALRPFGLFLPAIKYAIGPIASACGPRMIIKSNQPHDLCHANSCNQFLINELLQLYLYVFQV